MPVTRSTSGKKAAGPERLPSTSSNDDGTAGRRQVLPPHITARAVATARAAMAAAAAAEAARTSASTTTTTAAGGQGQDAASDSETLRAATHSIAAGTTVSSDAQRTPPPPAEQHSPSGACTKEFRFDYEFNDQADGWMKFHVIPATWNEAQMRCHAEGAVLASPLNNQLKAAIVSFVKKQKDSDTEERLTIFSGVHATFSKGDYTSIEGVPLLRLAVTWASGEPDNYDNAESCLAMMINSNGTMADVPCTNVLPYVCYKKNTQLAMTECGTTDTGYTLDRRTGSCYKFHKIGLLWSQAYMTCVAEGGYLAIINDDVEAVVVKEMFARYPEIVIFSNYKSTLMIGFHDWGQRGTSFRTIHGESLEKVFHKWSPGQPDNSWRKVTVNPDEKTEFGGNFFRSGLIDDIICTVPLAFLCEKDPNSLR